MSVVFCWSQIFAVFDIEVENGMIDAAQAFLANAHELVVVANSIEKEFIFDFCLDFSLAVLL